MRYRIAIRFAIQDDVRFISHHDTMRMFERALARTDLPVRFSEGFNPRPKLSLPLPRPVGIATRADVLVVEFTESVDPDQALRQLAAQMPRSTALTAVDKGQTATKRGEDGPAESVALQEAWVLSHQGTLQPEAATYVLRLPADHADRTLEQLHRIMTADFWPIQRGEGPGGSAKTLDLRHYLLEAGVESGSLHWTVRVTGAGSVRPSEVLAALGIDPQACQHRVCRTAITWASKPVVQPEAAQATCGLDPSEVGPAAITDPIPYRSSPDMDVPSN